MKRTRSDLSYKKRKEMYVTRTVTVCVSAGLEVTAEQMSEWVSGDVARFGHVVSDTTSYPKKKAAK